MKQENVIEMPRMDHADLVEAVKAEMEANGISQAKLAGQIGRSSAAVSQFLKGVYPGAEGNEKLAKLLEQWLESRTEKQRSLGDIPPIPPYTETGSSRRIFSALRYAQTFGDSCVIYGVPGVGKTCTAREYQRRAPNVWIATMSPATATTAAALEEVCEAMGIQDAGHAAARMKRAIARRLRGSDGLLIIDEAQHLSVKALEEIRTLNDIRNAEDQPEAGLVFMGSEVVHHRMTGGNRAAEVAQLFSRQGKWTRLKKTTLTDIRTIVAAWGVDDAGILRAAEDIGQKPGGLRGLTKVLRLASMFAAGEGQPLAREHVIAAWRDLGGEA